MEDYIPVDTINCSQDIKKKKIKRSQSETILATDIWNRNVLRRAETNYTKPNPYFLRRQDGNFTTFFHSSLSSSSSS